MPRGTRPRSAYSPLSTREAQLGVGRDENLKRENEEMGIETASRLEILPDLGIGKVDIEMMDDSSPPSPLSPLPPEDDLPLLSPHNGPHHLEADGSHLDLNHELSEDPEGALTAQQLNVDGTPRRPMNAFMIFARRRRPQVSAENTTMKTGQISKILSKEWGGMPMEAKQFYLDKAKELKDNFNNKYPDYVYRRRPNNSRRKRRAEGSTGATMATASSSSAISRVNTTPYSITENHGGELDNEAFGSDSGIESASPSLGKANQQSLSPVEGNSHLAIYNHTNQYTNLVHHGQVHHTTSHGVGNYPESNMPVHGQPNLSLTELTGGSGLASNMSGSNISYAFTSSTSLIPPQPSYGRGFTTHPYEYTPYNPHALNPASPISPISTISTSGGGSSIYTPSPLSAHPSRGYGMGGTSSSCSDLLSPTSAQTSQPSPDSQWPISMSSGTGHTRIGLPSMSSGLDLSVTGMGNTKERRMSLTGNGSSGHGSLPQLSTLTGQYRPGSIPNHRDASRGISEAHTRYDTQYEQNQVLDHSRNTRAYPISPISPRPSLSSSVESNTSNGGNNSLYPPPSTHHSYVQSRPPMLHQISTYNGGANVGRDMSPLSAVSPHSAVSHTGHWEHENR